jgi:two-component system response regulator AtoC
MLDVHVRAGYTHADSPEGKAMPRTQHPRTRVLVVDDEEQLLHFLEEYLARAGYQTECAVSGSDALARIEKERFDILLLDLRMPGMDGLDVLARAKEIDETLSVIIMTGYMTVDSAVKALKLGADDYLMKPLDPEVLGLAIARTVKQRRLQM